MKIAVNGKTKEIPAGTNIAGLLKILDILPERVVVERNESQIISRSQFEQVVIQEDDRLEILNFVGGGSR